MQFVLNDVKYVTDIKIDANVSFIAQSKFILGLK
jgi:hypothetical protein